MSLSWINDYVAGIAECCNSTNIYDVYNALDIDLIAVGKNDSILQGNEALYIRNYSGTEAVFIRDDLPFRYEKFVLAHELGHAILHTELVSASFNKNLLNWGKFERQANYFALKLLNIEANISEYVGYSVKQAAKALHVSEESLEYFLTI